MVSYYYSYNCGLVEDKVFTEKKCMTTHLAEISQI